MFGYLRYQSDGRVAVVITARSQKINAIKPKAALAPEALEAKIARKKNV